MKMCLALLALTPLFGAVADVQTTATQAVLTFTSATVCSDIDVREYGASTVIPDVDPTLFTGSNIISRTGSIQSGSLWKVVIGKRNAAGNPGTELALDGTMKSRAMQNATLHSYSLCGGTIAGTFTTKNAPLGQTLSEPMPVDRNNPGKYAWPTFSWTDRAQKIIDPDTGFQLKLLDYPEDASNNLFYTSILTTASGTNWTNAGNIIADDSSAATYNGVGQDPLFIPTNLYGYASNSPSNPSLTMLNLFMNAWAAASANAEVSLTIDGQAAISDWITYPLAACSSGCTTGNRGFVIAAPVTMLADWFTSNHGLSKVDLADFMRRGGRVDRSGTTVTWKSGDRFNLKWTSGSLITVNSVVYTIASVDHDAQITLQSGSGTDTNQIYDANNAGFLVRNKTTSGSISIQYAYMTSKITLSAVLESDGDLDIFNNCSPLTTQFSGEDGIRCINGNVVRWIGLKTLTVNRLGNVIPQTITGSGWSVGGPCKGAYWDQTDANAYLCTITDSQQETRVLKFVYSGSNVDIGDQFSGTAVTNCGSAPCWTVTVQTPNSLESMAAAFDPRWAASGFNVVGFQTDLVGHMSSSNALLFTMRWAGQDSACFMVKFDIATASIIASMPSWGSWPNRFGSCHGAGNTADPNYMIFPLTYFKGPISGTTDGPGHGPYVAKVTGAISSTPGLCPAAPVSLPMQIGVWPTGSHCSTFVLDGEPGDPSPSQDSTGTITTTGGSVVGSGTNFTKFAVGHQLKIGSSFFTVLTWTDTTHMTVSGSPGAAPGTSYTLFYENVNSSLLPDPNYAYLASIGVGDLMYLSNTNFNIDCPGGDRYISAGGCEVARVLSKTGVGPGLSIVVERGYAGNGVTHTASASYGAGGTVVMLPGGCTMAGVAPCAQTFMDWDTRDTFGLNPINTTLISDTGDQGCCHGTFQNLRVDIGQSCTTQDGQSGCYYARPFTAPSVFTANGAFVSYSPLFHSLAGVGYTNTVDSHASNNKFKAASGTAPYYWVGDTRPFLGDDTQGSTLFGSQASPGVATGQRYKFTAAQVGRLRPRILPSFAMCGSNPLLDVSGPAVVLGTTSADNYKYVRVLIAGEGVAGSQPGEVYANCPQIRFPWSAYPGIGQVDSSSNGVLYSRSMTIADMSMYTHASVQIGVQRPDPTGSYGRVVTKIGRYEPYTFANNKISPDGGLMFHWAVALNGVRTAIVLAKLPTFPGGDSINRGDYVPPTVKINAVGAGANNAIVQFGYDPTFLCTSRRDICVANAATVPTGLTPFLYASESPAGLACSTTCTIQIPAISDRVLYWRVILRDASNVAVRTDAVNVMAIP